MTSEGSIEQVDVATVVSREIGDPRAGIDGDHGEAARSRRDGSAFVAILAQLVEIDRQPEAAAQLA